MDYYILDLRTKKGDVCIFWRPNCAGYTRYLEEAGVYPQAEIDEFPECYNDGVRTKAVPIAQAAIFARKTVPLNFKDQLLNYPAYIKKGSKT